MSEHPPVPYAALFAALEAFQGSESPSIEGSMCDALNAIAPLLWREWTRGMAVVPLPEPDEGDSRWFPAGIGVTALQHQSGPRVDVDFGHYGIDWPGDVARLVFAAGLAACDRAELGAADATGVTP